MNNKCKEKKKHNSNNRFNLQKDLKKKNKPIQYNL